MGKEDGGPFDRAHVAEFYDHLKAYTDRHDVNFYVDLAKQSGGPVLELGCGTGRVLIPTARQGIKISGVDLSDDMLAICRSKLSQEAAEVQERIRIHKADIRHFDLGARFKLITIPFRPFQHLITVEEQLACLSCVRQHLEAGGRLVLDVFNPSLTALGDESGLTERKGSKPVLIPDGRRVMQASRTASLDLERQVISVELIYYVTNANGREERLVHAFPFRYFFRYEMEHLLARAGFEIEALYGDFDGGPYGSKHPGELIFVARKA